MPIEGIIKFKYICQDNKYIVPNNYFSKINPVRKSLKYHQLIGQDTDGICFGNVSIRKGKSNHFIISASDTGKIINTNPEHFVEITFCDIAQNLCYYKGQQAPSSETLSHFIIYKHCPQINAVIHIHNKGIWNSLKHKVPTSSPHVEYGSVEMVNEIIQLLENTNLLKEKILVMGGHEDGIISFGENINEALEKLLN